MDKGNSFNMEKGCMEIRLLGGSPANEPNEKQDIG